MVETVKALPSAALILLVAEKDKELPPENLELTLEHCIPQVVMEDQVLLQTRALLTLATAVMAAVMVPINLTKLWVVLARRYIMLMIQK